MLMTFFRALIWPTSSRKSLIDRVDWGCSASPLARAAAWAAPDVAASTETSSCGQPSSIQAAMKAIWSSGTACPPQGSLGNWLPSNGASPRRPLIRPEAADLAPKTGTAAAIAGEDPLTPPGPPIDTTAAGAAANDGDAEVDGVAVFGR